VPHGSSDRYYSQQYKKFLNIILKQLPKYIDKYPTSEQPYLKIFLEVLQGYHVDTQKARDTLTTKLREFTNEFNYSEIYYQLPFFWFAVDYFNTAIRLLSVATFYGRNFYSYLVQHLRGDSEVQGAFSLIKNITPLTDLKWEQLQYSCVKLQDPLTNEELQVLESIYTSHRENSPSIDFLNAEKIKSIIQNEINNPPFIRQLSRFFTRINAKWLLWAHRPAFGVEQLIFNFQLDNSNSLFDIIDFQDPKNTLLCTSDIYQVTGAPNVFHGTLTIPARDVNALSRYLEECNDQGKIKLYLLEKITEIKSTYSLLLYRANEGWYNLSPTKKDLLARKLKTNTPRKRKNQQTFFYCSPEFNQSWHYTKHHHPIKLIKVYCKEDRIFSYHDLLGHKNGLIDRQYSKLELELLDEIIQKKTIQVGFYLDSLLYEFSLNHYLVKVPQMTFFQLSRLLKWLPTSTIFFTKKGLYLTAFLSPDLVKWIRNSLNWPIMAINIYFARHKLDFNQMYNEKNFEWKVPRLLSEWRL
jgi:hypothetical protein